MTKAMLTRVVATTIALMMGSPAMAGDYCFAQGSTRTTESCINLVTTCSGGKLNTGELCTTTHMVCAPSARAQLAFPFSTAGEWEVTYRTEVFTPAYDSECPLE